MKNYILLYFLFILMTVYSQSDVRGVKWGSSIDAVIKSEYPLTPIISKNEIRFENVDIGNTTLANLIYTFTNGKLIELRYIVFGNSKYIDGVQTCKYNVPMYYKYIHNLFIFETLESKGYKCSVGWYFGGKKTDERYYENYVLKDKTLKCNFDKQTLDKLDVISKGLETTEVSIIMENLRSNLTINFNNPLYNNIKADCNSRLFTPDYYNTYFWLIFTPSYEVNKEILKSNF